MHFSIFLPQHPHWTRETLAACGLAALLREGDRTPVNFPLAGAGPGGHTGVVLDWGTANPGYYPDRQTWREIAVPGSAPYWLGLERDALPTPHDLARSGDDLVDGFLTRLGDGQEWVVPNVAKIPCDYALGDDGGIVRRTGLRFETLLGRMTWALGVLDREIRDGVSPDVGEAIGYAAEMLGVNYRITRDIALALGLFNDRNLGQVLTRSVDLPKLFAIQEEVRKKKAADAAA